MRSRSCWPGGVRIYDTVLDRLRDLYDTALAQRSIMCGKYGIEMT